MAILPPLLRCRIWIGPGMSIPFGGQARYGSRAAGRDTSPAIRLSSATLRHWPGSPRYAATLWKSEIARDTVPVDAGGSWPALSTGGEEHARRRPADRRISAVESKCPDSDFGGWRSGTVGIDVHQPLSRAKIRGADALPGCGRVRRRRPVEFLGRPGDRASAAQFAGTPRLAGRI